MTIADRWERQGFYRGYAQGYVKSHCYSTIDYLIDTLKLDIKKTKDSDLPARLQAALVMISHEDRFAKIESATDFVDYQIQYLKDKFEMVIIKKIFDDGLKLDDAVEITSYDLDRIKDIKKKIRASNKKNDERKTLCLVEKLTNKDSMYLRESDIEKYLDKF